MEEFYSAPEYMDTERDTGSIDPCAAAGQTSEHYAPAIWMGVISSVGLIFNTVVVIVIVILKDYKKTSHWYVLNLAFADGLFLFMLPLKLIENLRGQWHLGYPLCIAYSTVFYANYYASIFFLTAMSFDRYVAIVHPVSTFWRKFRCDNGCRTITVMVWLLAISVSLPILTKIKVCGTCDIDFHTNDPSARCILARIQPEDCEKFLNETETITMKLHEKSIEIYNESSISEEDFMRHMEEAYQVNESDIESWIDTHSSNSDPSCTHPPYPLLIAWIYSNFMLTFVMPVVIMIICYGCILWRVLHPHIRASGSSFATKGTKSTLTSSVAHRRTNNKLTILVVSLVLMFVVCWLPFHAVHLMKITKQGIDWSSGSCWNVSQLALLMAYSNSLLNPILYTFLGANFHKRLRDVWNRITTRNAATMEFIASFKHNKNNARSRYRGSLTKTTKTSDSSVAQHSAASTNFQIHVTKPMCHQDHCTHCTTAT